MKTGNDICPKCLTAHPATMDCEIMSFLRPYADAGHDLLSLFRSENTRCSKCGAAQIDLSEDLVYGDMTKCVKP